MWLCIDPGGRGNIDDMAFRPEHSTRITRGSSFAVRHPSARSRACLIQYSGETLGRRYLLDVPEIAVGRSSVNGIVIHDDSVSRHHARIISSGNVVAVEDLGSSNGTFVQDRLIASRTTLHDGDILRLGNVLLKYIAHDNIENVFHDKIYRMATVDAGTQLFNKQYLLESLDSEFRHCRVHGRPLSVIYYDLDFFKKVNDTHGHGCGDYILRESARIAKSCMRVDDILARYGGEEFVAVLPNTEGRMAVELAQRMRKAVADHVFVYEGKSLRQTMSLGVSESRPEFATAADLLSDADRKLYQSKNGGRNRVTA